MKSLKVIIAALLGLALMVPLAKLSAQLNVTGGVLSGVTSISSSVAMGEINYFSLVGTAVTITAQSTTGTDNAVKVDPATALTAGGNLFDNGGANDGRLRYTGAATRMSHVAASVSFSGGNSDTFTVMLARNGTVITTSTVAMRKMGTGGDVGSTAIHGMIELATNQYVEVFVANTTNTDDPTFHSVNIFAMGN